jgi:hypothetical protein
MRFRTAVFDSALIVFFVFLIIFLFSLTSNFTGPHDSMTYLEMLKTRQHLWHPHHLLYHQFTYYWLHLLKSFLPTVPDYFLVESFSSLFGAGTVAIVFLFFRRRFQLPLLTSWIATAIVAFSYGVWFYSINVEVYAPSLLFTVACLYQLSKREWDATSVWLTALFHALAILFHQMNILITPIVIYKIIEQRRNIFVLKSLFWYALTGIVLVGGIYFAAGRWGEGHDDIKGWIGWIEGYTATDEYWRSLTWKTPLLAGTGFTHTILGGHFVFRLGLERWFTSLLHAHSLDDEFFLVKNMSREGARTLFILSLILLAFAFFLFVKFLSRFQFLITNYYYCLMPLLLYFGIYSLYFLFWMPEILEFWLGQCIVFWLLLIGTYGPVNTRFNVVLGTIAALIFFINFTGSIRPMQNINNDIGYVRIEKVKELAGSNDLIIVENPWLLKEFLEYYTPASIVQKPTSASQADSLSQAVEQRLRNGGKVFLFAEPENEKSKEPAFIPQLLRLHKDHSQLIQEKPAIVWMLRGN